MNINKFLHNLHNDKLPIQITTFNYSENQSIKLSVVMTTHCREKQTLFTLDSINMSSSKDCIEVILVDDSPSKSLEYIERISSFEFPLTYIEIDYSKKEWINPCVNYNIGFSHVKGNSVIIQNSEVCHIGDVITEALKRITNENYLVFDVCTTLNLADNDKLRTNMTVNDFFSSNIYLWWYQHKIHRNGNLHFLTCISNENLKKLNGFDYDFSNGIWYDDNELIYRIQNVLKLNVESICHSETNVLGIHQFHEKNKANTFNEELSNKGLFNLKEEHFKKTGEWIYFYKKQIVTITGIRPDFIRMKNIFQKLDENFNHILVHTGQHYDSLLSEVFFQELSIRSPDYILNIGKHSKTHSEQLAYLSVGIIKLFKLNEIKPDLIIFLGDSNSVLASIVLKKEGYKICHVEAGMRSFDTRMFEEINRKICDNCSDLLFVYHENYKTHLLNENIKENIHVVGNTIVEVCNEFKNTLIETPKMKDFILMDIHRPENFNDKHRLKQIIEFGNECSVEYNVPVFLIGFGRTMNKIKDFDIPLKRISTISLLSFKDYLYMTYHCKFLISDSGTGQEEPALLNTKVVVPRDFTERPESYENNCSIEYDMKNSKEIFEWLNSNTEINTDWLGNGNTSNLVIQHIIEYFNQ